VPRVTSPRFYNRFVSTGGQELFVVCKSCGSEVSPYITECPYCGNRLRKRAPKLDREGRPAERKLRKPAPPILPRLRRDEIPGIRPDRRPYATGLLLALGLVGCLLWRTGLVDETKLIIFGKPGSQWWRLFTAAFTYDNTGYAFVALGAVALFGWLLERRHGPLAVTVLFLVGGVGGLAATAAAYPLPEALGANGGALALVCAWAVPDLLELRHGGDVEGDLIGAAAIALAIVLMPLALSEASWMSDVVGALAGFGLGLPLARFSAR
jgi:membrane associated rhomboid family serine protease